MGCVASIFKEKRFHAPRVKYRSVPTMNPYSGYGTNGENRDPTGSAVCQACGTSFSSKAQLSGHIRAAHSGNIEKEVRKQEADELRKQERAAEKKRLWDDVQSETRRSREIYSNDGVVAVGKDEERSKPSWKSKIKSKLTSMSMPKVDYDRIVNDFLADKPKKKKTGRGDRRG
jgi:hypothetical protein